MQRTVRSIVQLLGILSVAYPLVAQVSVVLNESRTYPAARIGLNQGNQNYYAGYQLKNITAINPGFEGQLRDLVQNVAGDGSNSGFTSGNPWDQVPNNYFAGGTFFVAYGANKGCTGKIASNTAAKQGSQGPEFKLSTSCPHAFHRGDVVFTGIELSPIPDEYFNFNSFGWQKTSENGGVVRIDGKPADQPTQSSGKECLELDTNAAPEATAGVNTGFDTGAHLEYTFRGTYVQSIKAKVLAGSHLKLTFSGVRLNPHHDGVRWSQTIPIEGGWKTYSVHFFSDEGPTTEPGPVQIYISLSGQGSALIDDSSLVGSADNNPTVFRNQVLDDEKIWNPGEGRYWAEQNGETLTNWIKPQFGREGSAETTATYNQGAQIQYGLHDWLVKEAYEGVPQVWIELPITWRYTIEAKDIVDYLAGGPSTAFGARRIELGQRAPWTSVFRRIVVEYGNEVWNTGTPGEDVMAFTEMGRATWPYLDMAIDFCSAMKSDPNWSRSVMKCAAGIQSGGPFWTRQLLAKDKNHSVDIQANNEYGQFSPTEFAGYSQWISAWTEAWSAAHDMNSGFYKTFNAGLQSGVYEFNNSTGSNTPITQAQANGYPEGEGYGLVDILMPLFNQKAFGIIDNDFFVLAHRERSFRNTAGKSVVLKEWGAVVALGGKTKNARPMMLAASMVNGCIGDGTGYEASPVNGPTYSFSGYNGVGPARAVPYLNFFAFKNGNARCIVAVNVDPLKSYKFSFSGNNPPAGTVALNLYSSPRLTDNNETSMMVNLKPSTVLDPQSFEIPPHSAMSISYTVTHNVSMPRLRHMAERASVREP